MDVEEFFAAYGPKLSLPRDPLELAFLSSYEKKLSKATNEAARFDSQNKHVVETVVESGESANTVAKIYCYVLEDYLSFNEVKEVCVVAMRGGKFAVAIFDSKGLVLEDFHASKSRYTSRKGQGSTQSSHDSQGKRAKSAGANLRRAGERRLREEFEAVLDRFSKRVENQCSRVYFSLPKASGEVSKLKNRFKNAKVTKIPFGVSEVTLESLKNVVKELRTVRFDCVLNDDQVVVDEEKVVAPPKETPTLLELARSKSASSEEDLSCEVFKTRRIHEMCAGRTEVDEIEEFLLEAELSLNDQVEEDVLTMLDEQGRTPLHLACESSRPKVVRLLLEYGANPIKKDFRSRACFFNVSRQVLSELRSFRLRNSFEFDYDSIGFPPPADDDEQVKAKRAKQAEKRRLKKARQKQKKKALKEEEARAVKALKKTGSKEVDLNTACDECGGALPKSFNERFHRTDNVMCSLDCVREHARKKRLEAISKRMN